MMNILRILKIITCVLLVAFFLSVLVQLFFPDAYTSYRTGYSVDSIVGHRTGNSDQSLLCKEFFPEKVSQAMGGIWIFSILTLIASFISILIFKLLLIKKEFSSPQLKHATRNFIIIFFISFLMLFEVFLDEYTYDYVVGCKQLQSSCKRLRENSEEFGREGIEDFHARDEFLYCD